MFEMLNDLGGILPYLKLAALAVGLALALITVAAVTYLVQTTCRPLLAVVQWLVGYTPGQEPGEIISGTSYGARMVAWASLIGLVIWVFLH